MGKESSRSFPNGRGSVKWPEMQEILQLIQCLIKYMKSCFDPFTVKQQTREHQKYFWNTSGKKKKTIRHEKIKPQANVIN